MKATNNTRLNKKAKGQHQKRVKKAILSLFEKVNENNYKSTYELAEKGCSLWNDNGCVKVVHYNELVRVI